jgi:hypothetical protein
MTRAWVGDLENGRGFSAYVDYGGEGPFTALPGPDGVPLEEALGWARANSERVSVRLGDTHYSAGRQAIESLPVWTGADPDPLPAQRHGRPSSFAVEARTAWSRSDRDGVAQRLASAVADQPGVVGASAVSRKQGFSVLFEVTSPSLQAAREDAFVAIRTAWHSSGIEARPGEDWDLTSLSVSPDARM